MKKTSAFKLLTELTFLKNASGNYMPVRVTRRGETDFMLVMETVAPLTPDNRVSFEELSEKYGADMNIAGAYVVFT